VGCYEYIYDVKKYTAHDFTAYPASEVLKTGRGICNEYSFLYAALPERQEFLQEW
jgi:hypothetical protein